MKTLIFTGYGINSDLELAECFQRAGSAVEIKHLNEIIADKKTIFKFDILAFPGGFSFGDHIASGKIFANKIKIYLLKEITEFVAQGNPVLGICNGFQVLVKCGLLPQAKNFINPTINTHHLPQQATLTHNDSGQFENRWVTLQKNPHNKSLWLKNITEIQLPIRHGEGKFYATPDLIEDIKKNNQIALQYIDREKKSTQQYPANPNGSLAGIAAITNKRGNILGMMPHPEAYINFYHQPNWKSSASLIKTEPSLLKKEDGQGMIFFYNAVNFVKRRDRDSNPGYR